MTDIIDSATETQKLKKLWEPLGIGSKQDEGRLISSAIDSSAEDTPKELALRELTQNALESCMKKKEASNVEGKDYQGLIEISNADGNMEIKDNGLGCDSVVFEEHFKTIFNSSHHSDGTMYDENKGLGGKTSSLPWSDLDIQSKVADEQWAATLGKDESTGNYAARMYPYVDDQGDEDLTTHRDMSDEECDKIFRKEKYETGFCATLSGRKETEGKTAALINNALANKGFKSRGSMYSVLRCLNHRYWELPDYIDMRIRPINNKVIGTKKWLQKISKKQVYGSMVHKDIMLRLQFAILDPKKSDARNTKHSSFAHTGVVGLIYKNENYGNHQESASARYAALRKAGITAGTKNLQLYVIVPETEKIKVSVNRTHLLYDNLDGTTERLELNDILCQIKENLPQEIKDYVFNNYDQEINGDSINSALKKYLKNMKRQLHTVPNDTKVDPNGEIEEMGPGQEPNPDSPPRKEKKKKGSKSSKPKKLVAKTRLNNGEPPAWIATDLEDKNKNIEWNEQDYEIYANTDSYYLDFIKKTAFPRVL